MSTFLNIFRSFIIGSIIALLPLLAQEKEMKAGMEAYERKDFVKAVEMFRKVTDEDKKSPDGFLWLAKALIAADSVSESSIPLALAKVLDANNAMAYHLQGDAYMKQKIYVAAVGEYQRAIELDPKNLEPLLKLAEAQRKARQYNDAAKTYQTVLAKDSMNITALRELGTVYYRAKQFMVALPYIEKLAKLMPDSSDIQVKYVKCLSEANRDQELLSIAEVLVAKDASLVETQEILDKAYVKLKMNSKVIDSYKNRNLESLKVEDLVRYVKALQSEQVYDTAEVVYTLLFKKDPARCDMRYYFGTNEMKIKKWPDAVEQFEKKIECDTSAGFQFASHLNAAMSLMQLKKFKDAVDHTKKALEYRPDNVQAWTVLAECYGQMEQIDEEIRCYKKVIDLATGGDSNGDDPRYPQQLQEAYRMIGVRKLIVASEALKTKKKEPEEIKTLFAETAKYLVKAIQLKPGDCEALLWAGQAFQNSNNKEDAIKYYKKTIASCPGSKQADQAKDLLKSLEVK